MKIHTGTKAIRFALFVLLMVCMLVGGSALAASYPESAHPYANNANQSWTYTHPTAAESLNITFSADTDLENPYDKVYITGSDGTVQTFSGTNLQSRTISVAGNSFTIRLTSDSSVNRYGFRITNITAVTPVKTGTCGKTGSSINWTLDLGTGLLTLAGSGEMADYDYYYDNGGKYDDSEEYYTHPWDSYLTKVTEIVVGEGITSLGEYAFGGLTKVTKVTLPSTLVSIGNYAFEDVKITSIALPEGLTTIGSYAFTGTSITSVDLPSTLTSLAERAFPTAVALNFHENTPHGTLNDEGTLTWDVVGEVLTIRGAGEIPNYRWVTPKEDPDYSTAPWYKYSQVDQIVVSNGITVLGENAFMGMYVTSVKLPSSLTTIRSGAVYCFGLNALTVPSSVTLVESGAFHGQTAITGLAAHGTQGDMTWKIVSGELIVSGTMPNFSYHTMTDRYDTNYPVTPWRSYFANIKKITVESGITRIGNNAFYGCYNAETVNIPYSVTSIGVDAFYNCSSVTAVNYVTDYSQSASGWPLITFDELYANPMAYSGKAKLYRNGTEITWFSALQGDVSAYAFANCQNTFGVAASGGKIYKVGDYGFYNCKNLTEASLPTSLQHVGERAFYGCSSLNYTYRLFEGLTYIGNEAFYGCSSLEYVYMADDYINNPITFMGYSAFQNCTSLTTVVMSSIEEVSSAAFYGCTALTKVTLDDSVKVIQASAFAHCDKLQNFTWPPALERIGRYAFEGCDSLNVCLFPDTLKKIEAYAFRGCIGLRTISLPESLETLGDSVFSACTSLTKVAFKGQAPAFDSDYSTKYHFRDVTATVTYFPGDSWKNKTLNYGGKLTWQPVGGSCGEEANWLLTEDGMLRINGSGMVEAGEWAAYADRIDEILITSKITAIADNTFAGLSNVTKIGFAGTCTEIGENAFAGITADVYWTESQQDMRVMCEEFETPYAAGFGGALNWHNPVCYVSELSSYYAIYCGAHTLVEQAAADPACTVDGNLQHWRCSYSKCKLCFEDAEASILKPAESFVIPATGHSYHEAFLWQEDGSACQAQFTCEACGDVQTLDTAVASEEVKAPECLVNGDTSYTATVEFEQEIFTDTIILSDIPATGHTEVTIEGFAPECEVPGVTDYIFCEVCGEELQMAEEIPATGHTETVTLEAAEPTCTEDGHTQEISCSVCEAVLTESESIAATGHTEYVSAEAVDPDCINTGLTEEISCSVCHEVLTAAETVPALGHTSVTDEAVAPDCVNTGLTEGSHCAVCDEILVAQETVDALGHTEEVDQAVVPTDYETGLTEGSHCSVCGEVLTAQQVIPANFTYDGTTVTAYNASATDVVIPDGVTALSATLFKNNKNITSVRLPESVVGVGNQTFFGCTALTDVWLPDSLTGITQQTFYQVTAKLHVSADSATAVALSYRGLAFTTEDGYILRYRVTSATGKPMAVWIVNWLGSSEHVFIPDSINQITVAQIHAKAFAGHEELLTIRIPAGVTSIADDAFEGCSAGLKILSPADAYAREWADANGFAWEHDQHSEMTLEYVAPTCTENGLTEGLWCGECGHIFTAQESIPANGHTVATDAAVEPTCTENGLTEGEHCSVCAEVLVEQEVIPAKGHTEVIDEAVEATCTETGLTEGKHCSVCDEVLVAQEVVPAKGHTEVIDEAVEATCTESGLTEGKHCTVCGEVLVAQEVVPAKGHTEVMDEAAEPTCTETGLTEGEHCSVCAEVLVEQEVIPANGHTVATDAAVEPTCTENGLTEGKHCSVCDEVLVAQEVVPAKGHTEVIDEAVEATCSETGLTEGKHCSVCDEVLVAQEVVPAKGHTEVIDEAVEATCSETGLTEGKHCSVCDEVTEQQSVIDIDAQNHINVVEVDGYAEIAQQDDDHHKMIQYKDHCCADCGTMIAQNVSSIVVEDIDHRFREYTHSEERDFAQLDEKMHSYTGVMIKNQHCEDCGYHRSVVVGEETLLQGHYYGYLNDVCNECGYVNQCQHEVTTKFEWADENCQFTSISTTHHTATGLVGTTVWCNLCGTYLEMSEEDGTRTLEHEAYEDGICIYCGYEGADVTLNSCEHENTVTGDNEIGQEFVYENLNCDATHTYGGHEYGTIVCLECGEIIRDFQSVHSLVETTPHDYNDGYCALCGHTCSHSKTESIPGTTEGIVCSYCGTTLTEPPTAPVSVSLVPASRIAMDDIPFGMAMDLTVEDGRIHAWIDGEATDWDRVVTFNEPLLLHNPDTDETWYENSAVNFGMSIRAPEGAAYVCYGPGNWQNDDAIVASMEASELENASYSIPGWWNEIALIDGTNITTVSLGGEGYDGPTTYAVRWADENGQTILIEKVDLCFEHSASNKTYATSPVLIPAEDILANVTGQSYVRSDVDDGSVSYEFVSDWPDIVTEVNAPVGTATYSMHKQFREGYPEHYELTDGRCVGYQLYGWQEGTAQSTSSDLLCWYDANGKLIGGGWITIETVQRELSQGPAFKLPAALTEIRAEAFIGSGTQVIILPDGCLNIGSRAFADCANLQEIHIPASVQSIADDALDNCGSDLIIVTTEGSTAQTFAEDNHILCVIR